jgi:hypothetical protein
VVLAAEKWDEVDDLSTLLESLRAGACLPHPGSGNTAERFAQLRSMSACCPSLGRVLEAHVDALTIFLDADHEVPASTALAVWASSSRSTVKAETFGNGLRLNGSQAFCGGASIVDGALMSVACNGGERLVLLRLNQKGLKVDPTSWKTPAFSSAAISTVHFEDVHIAETNCVGQLNFYAERPGFWWGAVGVAACWAGICDALLTMQQNQSQKKRKTSDELSLVSLGRTTSLRWGIDACLAHAASLIDAPAAKNVSRRYGDAQKLALSVRQQIATAASAILETVTRDAGPAPIAFDPEWARISTELRLAIGQSHGDRDLRQLGGLLRGFRAGFEP